MQKGKCEMWKIVIIFINCMFKNKGKTPNNFPQSKNVINLRFSGLSMVWHFSSDMRNKKNKGFDLFLFWLKFGCNTLKECQLCKRCLAFFMSFLKYGKNSKSILEVLTVHKLAIQQNGHYLYYLLSAKQTCRSWCCAVSHNVEIWVIKWPGNQVTK